MVSEDIMSISKHRGNQQSYSAITLMNHNNGKISIKVQRMALKCWWQPTLIGNSREIMPGTGSLANLPGIMRLWILEKNSPPPLC